MSAGAASAAMGSWTVLLASIVNIFAPVGQEHDSPDDRQKNGGILPPCRLQIWRLVIRTGWLSYTFCAEPLSGHDGKDVKR